MSESYTVIPVNSEVRDWLQAEGNVDLPSSDGKNVTFSELKNVIASLPDVSTDWSSSSDFPDGNLSTPDGLTATIIVGAASDDHGFCQFHFRGGHIELIETVVRALASFAGPQVIHAHSGCYTKVLS